MAKFCPNCGKELEENAELCLNCGKLVQDNSEPQKKKKKKGMPGWAIALIVLACLLPVAFIAMLVAGMVMSSEPLYGSIGDTLETNGLSMTLTDAVIYGYIGDDEKLLDEPAEGNEYLVFTINVKNIDYEKRSIVNSEFYGKVDGMYSQPITLLNDVYGVKQLSGVLPEGLSMEGYVAFEIDEDWTSFELCYEDDDYDQEIIFQVLNNTSDDNLPSEDQEDNKEESNDNITDTSI